MASPYKSDFTRFLEDLKRANPEIETQQRVARAIWWEKEPLDLDQAARDAQSRVAQQGYVYQSSNRADK